MSVQLLNIDESDRLRDSLYEIWAAQVVNRSSVAALAFLVWDVLINLENEVEYVWRKPWTWTKALYLFVRYFAVAVQISLLFVGTEITALLHFTPHDCYVWFVYQAVAVQVLISSVEIVLILRVEALYSNAPVLINILRALFILELAAMGTSIHYTLKGLDFNEVCIVTFSSYAIIGYGAAAIAFESILFALTSLKYFQVSRSGWNDNLIVRLLARDGTWWFGLIFLTMLANAICYSVVRGALSASAFCWLISVLSYSGAHLMLNMFRLSPSASPHANIHDSAEYGNDSHLVQHRYTYFDDRFLDVSVCQFDRRDGQRPWSGMLCGVTRIDVGASGTGAEFGHVGRMEVGVDDTWTGMQGNARTKGVHDGTLVDAERR